MIQDQDLLPQSVTRVEGYGSSPSWNLQGQGKRKGDEEKFYLLSKRESLGAHIPLG